MEALYYIGENRMELRDIPVPTPDSGEYLIKIEACGICGSDVEGFQGKTGRRLAPMIMGHECAGVISKAPNGGILETGSNVVVFPKLYCGECDSCRRGFYNLCPSAGFLGVMNRNGAMTEYICVKEKYVIPYNAIAADIASMTEPAAVAYSAVYKLSNMQIAGARNILIIGAGTIGLLALLWLKYRGAKRVIVSDTSEYRLELAKCIGADAVINPVSIDFEKNISELTDNEMCDISIEAVGISQTAEASVEALKNAGCSIWIGNAVKMVSVNMQKIVTRELRIKGSYIYSSPDDFRACLKLLSEKVIDISPIITRHMCLNQGVAAFELLRGNKDGKTVKVILTNSEGCQ